MSCVHPSTPEGPAPSSGAPNLPAGFTDTFTSRVVDAGDVRLHAVIGGDGPPLLLVHGWPETWYAWRLVMPALARDFEVIAVDQRGIGPVRQARGGYDTGTLAADLVGADGRARPRAVRRRRPRHRLRHQLRARRGPPGPGRPRRPRRDPRAAGRAPSPPVFVPAPVNDRLWHIPFNRVETLPEQLVTGREDVFFGYEFAIQGGKTLPAELIDYYVAAPAPTPTPCAAASGSTGRSTPPSRRTRSARPGRCRCRSWRSAGREATATTSRAHAAPRRRRAERW